jgi:hypothetical protein
MGATTSEQRRLAHSNSMVTVMDQAERNALHAADKERSAVMLDPEACQAAVAEERAAPTVVHRDDGYSCDWAKGMPRPEPASQPSRTLTDAETEQKRADEWTRFIDSRIAKVTGALKGAIGEVIGVRNAKLRKEFTAEIEKLRAEIASLRADVTIANAHAGATVVDLQSSRRAG